MVGEEKQIKYLIENFTRVMEIIHGLEASVKQEEEIKKKKIALAKSETLESVKLEKFSGQGDNEYLKYYVWFTDFSSFTDSRVSDFAKAIFFFFISSPCFTDASDPCIISMTLVKFSIRYLI